MIPEKKLNKKDKAWGFLIFNLAYISLVGAVIHFLGNEIFITVAVIIGVVLLLILSDLVIPSGSCLNWFFEKDFWEPVTLEDTIQDIQYQLNVQASVINACFGGLTAIAVIAFLTAISGAPLSFSRLASIFITFVLVLALFITLYELNLYVMKKKIKKFEDTKSKSG